MTVLDDRESATLELQMRLPGMDGYTAERLTVGFGGSVDLNRTDADDVKFLEGLTMGKEVTLSVTAFVTRKGFDLRLGKDGADSAGYGVGLKVTSVEVA